MRNDEVMSRCDWVKETNGDGASFVGVCFFQQIFQTSGEEEKKQFLVGLWADKRHKTIYILRLTQRRQWYPPLLRRSLRYKPQRNWKTAWRCSCSCLRSPRTQTPAAPVQVHGPKASLISFYVVHKIVSRSCIETRIIIRLVLLLHFTVPLKY